MPRKATRRRKHDGILIGRREVIDRLVSCRKDGGGHDQNSRGDQIDRNDLQRTVFPHRPVLDAFAAHQHQRRRRRESFVPSGKRKSQRRFHDRGPNNRICQARRLRDQLFAHALRVRVSVGPAPVVRTMHSAIAQPFADRTRIRGSALARFLDELFVPFQFFRRPRNARSAACRFVAGNTRRSACLPESGRPSFPQRKLVETCTSFAFSTFTSSMRCCVPYTFGSTDSFTGGSKSTTPARFTTMSTLPLSCSRCLWRYAAQRFVQIAFDDLDLFAARHSLRRCDRRSARSGGDCRTSE